MPQHFAGTKIRYAQGAVTDNVVKWLNGTERVLQNQSDSQWNLVTKWKPTLRITKGPLKLSGQNRVGLIFSLLGRKKTFNLIEIRLSFQYSTILLLPFLSVVLVRVTPPWNWSLSYIIVLLQLHLLSQAQGTLWILRQYTGPDILNFGFHARTKNLFIKI